MKKLLMLLILMTLGWGVRAQCPLHTAVDFTATDCHGTEVHLFDILDSGQYVLIDFFFYNCSGCNITTPMMVQSYQAFGCNMYDVYYMEISDRDSDAMCQNWVANYGVEYPTISGPAGGSSIVNQYMIGAFPCVILIAPDRSIVINDLWPINNVQDIVTALENHGIQQHDCDVPNIFPQVSIHVDLVTETDVVATFTPLEACTIYYYTLATETEIQQWTSLTGLSLPEYLQSYGFPGEDIISHTFNDLTPNTDYVLYAVPSDENNILYEVVQVPVTTTSGSAEIIPDFTGTDLEGNEIHLYSILDAGQAVFINFFLTGDEYSEAIMPAITEAYQLYGCNTQEVFFMEISPNGHNDACLAWVEQFGVDYPTISRDGGGNAIAQSIPVALYPTLMLIRPNHEIAVRDIYPPTLEYIIDAFDNEGYEQYPCYEETLTFDVDTLWVYDYGSNASILTIYNNTAETEVHLNKITISGETAWFYFIYGDQRFLLNEDIDIPITQGENIQLSVKFNIQNKDMYYPVLSFENTLETVSLVTAFEWTVGIYETKTTTILSPNPANDFVTFKGESLGVISIYNAFGQKMDEFFMEGDELYISTANYENGIYYIKSDEQVFRFVITH